MYKIGVIGDGDSISGFAAVGLDIFPAPDAEAAGELLRQLVSGGEYGILYLTEEYAEALREDCAALAERLTPAVIPIPSCRGSTGYGVARVRGWVEQAVGSDIIFGED